MHLLASFILQNFKKILRANPKLWCVIFGPKIAHLPWTKVLWHKPLLLSSTYCPFSLCKIKKNFYSRSKVMRMHHFWAQNGPFASNNFFFGKLLISFSSLTISPFHYAKFKKKFFHQIQSYEDAQYLGPKWTISPNENFFRKHVKEPCFFHLCLSTCHKSKSDINLLVKYWQLKNTEISLTDRHFRL